MEPPGASPVSAARGDRFAQCFREEAESGAAKVVVNLRFDAALLAKVDAAAKREGITRTAWLHRAAFDALAGATPETPSTRPEA